MHTWKTWIISPLLLVTFSTEAQQTQPTSAPVVHVHNVIATTAPIVNVSVPPAPTTAPIIHIDNVIMPPPTAAPIVNVTIPPAEAHFWYDVIGATLPILLGVIAFVIGQFVLKMIIEPIVENRRVITRIITALTVYRNVQLHKAMYPFANDLNMGEMARESKTIIDEASLTLRHLAADLRASVANVPYYNFWARCRMVQLRSNAMTIAGQIDRWAGFHETNPEEAQLKIRTLLGINE